MSQLIWKIYRTTFVYRKEKITKLIIYNYEYHLIDKKSVIYLKYFLIVSQKRNNRVNTYTDLSAIGIKRDEVRFVVANK